MIVASTRTKFIRGVSPFEEKAKPRDGRGKRKKTMASKINICLHCEKETCEKGYCEHFGR